MAHNGKGRAFILFFKMQRDIIVHGHVNDSRFEHHKCYHTQTFVNVLQKPFFFRSISISKLLTKWGILLSGSLLNMATADKETIRTIKADETNYKLSFLFLATDVT